MSETATPQAKKLKWILPILIIAAGIALTTLMVSSKPQAPSRPVTEKVWSVRTISAQPGQHQPTLVLYGKVETPRMTKATSAVTAFVKEVNTDEGRSIAEDEVLIQLDDSDAKLLVAQRQADINNYEAQLETEKVRHEADLKALKIEKNLLQLSLKTVKRYENLIKRKVSSQEQLDAARRDSQQQRLSLTQREQSIADHPNRIRQIESQLQRATSLLQSAQLDLTRTQIKAPFNGRIANLNVAPGDRVRAGDPLLQMYSLERLEVRSQIPSRVLPQLRSLQSELNQISAQGQIDGQSLELQLDRIAAEVNGGRAGVDAFFQIQTTEYQPEPGRSLSIDVHLPALDQVIPIPPIALYGLDRVYKVVDERLQAVAVNRIGDSKNSAGDPVVLIRSNELQPGDRIVTTQLPNAITGLRVKEVATDA